MHVTLHDSQAGQTFYVGQVLAFAFSGCPNLMMQASGQVLQASQYMALYSLLGNQ